MELLRKISLLVLVFLGAETFAQKIEIGAGVGAMNYKGDISPDFHPSFARLGANVSFRYNLTKMITFKSSILVGSIYGDDTQVSDSFNQLRGQTFKTGINEFSLTTEYNFFDYRYNRYHKDWTPYVFAGLGAMKFSPRDTPVSDYKTLQMVIPFGVGIKYNISGPWNLNLEFGTRKTFTDYLDNLGGDNAALPKNLQNDYSSGDMYYYTSLSLTYQFLKIYCPK
jgi:hypothetical protein